MRWVKPRNKVKTSVESKYFPSKKFYFLELKNEHFLITRPELQPPQHSRGEGGQKNFRWGQIFVIFFPPNLMIITVVSQLCSTCVYIVSYATYAATSPSKFLEVKLIRFGRYLGKFEPIWADLIRFWQNQNLASSKKFDLLQLCQSVFYSLLV